MIPMSWLSIALCSMTAVDEPTTQQSLGPIGVPESLGRSSG
jgi:hypothetical protein